MGGLDIFITVSQVYCGLKLCIHLVFDLFILICSHLSWWSDEYANMINGTGISHVHDLFPLSFVYFIV